MNISFYSQKVDTEYVRRVANALCGFRGGPLGFRNAGSSAEHQAARFVEEEMRRIGLADVVREPFPVDTWEYRSAALTYSCGNSEKTLNLAPFAAGGTSGITAELVFAGRGTRQDCDRYDVRGKIALIDIDMRDEWWVNYPAYQLMLRGALAVIVNSVSGYAEINEDAYITHDFCGLPEIPVFSVPVRAAREIKELAKASGGLIVTLKADNAVTPGGVSYNVSGRIPGSVFPDEFILFSAHYDAHMIGFQDDAVAVGQILAMASALLDSKPKRTLIFLAHGAEEWGAIDTRYDWCIGAWNNVLLHPEWAGKTIVNLNFEMTALSNFAVRATPELVSFIREGSNVEVHHPLRAWSDDFSYSLAGIPALVNAFDMSDFMRTKYHTNFDAPDTWDGGAMRRNLLYYGHLAYAFDEAGYVPLDFSHRFMALKDSFESENHRALLDKLIDASKLLYGKLCLAKSRKSGVNNALLALYKQLQDNFVRLNWFAEPITEHSYYQHNIAALTCGIEAAKANRNPKEHLITIDDSFYDAHFDREVISRFANQALNQPAERLFWASGRHVDRLDLFDLINNEESLTDSKTMISDLQSLLQDQQDKFSKSLLRAYGMLECAYKDLKSIIDMLTE